MTTLYKPVLIESAEQAEALPVGTVAIDLDGQGQPRQASIRVHCGWYCTGEVAADGSPWLASHDVMAGDTALVPIEAEEERTRPVQLYASAVHVAPPSNATKPSRRLVTPWEAA